MPVLRRGKGTEQRGVHSEWDVAFFLGAVMIAEKSHFTSHCHVYKTASAKAHPKHSSEKAPVLSSTCRGPGPIKKKNENLKGRGWGWRLRDKCWQHLLLWLLMAYWSKWHCVQLSFVKIVFIHTGEVKWDWITQPKKRLFFPLNPAGQGPITVHTRF